MLTKIVTPTRSPLARRSMITRMIEESILDGYRDEIYSLQDSEAHEGSPRAAVSCLVRDLPRSSGLDGVTDDEIERAIASLA